jgi:hypothetical protein
MKSRSRGRTATENEGRERASAMAKGRAEKRLRPEEGGPKRKSRDPFPVPRDSIEEE